MKEQKGKLMTLATFQLSQNPTTAKSGMTTSDGSVMCPYINLRGVSTYTTRQFSDVQASSNPQTASVSNTVSLICMVERL